MSISNFRYILCGMSDHNQEFEVWSYLKNRLNIDHLFDGAYKEFPYFYMVPLIV